MSALLKKLRNAYNYNQNQKNKIKSQELKIKILAYKLKNL